MTITNIDRAECRTPLIISRDGILFAFRVSYSYDHIQKEAFDYDVEVTDTAWDPESWVEAYDATSDHVLSPLWGMSAADAASVDLELTRPAQPPSWMTTMIRDQAFDEAVEAAQAHHQNEEEVAL